MKREEALVDLRIQALESNKYFVEPEAKVALVIRIKTINRVPPKPRKVLRLFRLRRMQNAVFVRINKATLNMLRIIEPWVAYGYPSLETVRKLVYKRGHIEDGNKRVRLLDNLQVYNKLGDKDIVCIEDLVYQL